MRIDTNISYLPAAQRTSSLSINTLSIQSKSSEQPDFTHMTRQEMRDWVNEQLRTGKMTFEESSPFVAMTIKISAITGKEVPAESDTEQLNFIEKAQAGLQYALSRNNETNAKLLASLLTKMLC